jgi:hypothetical protein
MFTPVLAETRWDPDRFVLPKNYVITMIKITPICTGSARMKRSQQVGREGRSAFARKVDIFRDKEWVSALPILAFLVEHSEGRFLVDTGDTAENSTPGPTPKPTCSPTAWTELPTTRQFPSTRSRPSKRSQRKSRRSFSLPTTPRDRRGLPTARRSLSSHSYWPISLESSTWAWR